MIRYEDTLPEACGKLPAADAVAALFPELSPRQVRNAFRARDVKRNGTRVPADAETAAAQLEKLAAAAAKLLA